MADEIYRAQVALLLTVMPIVARQTCFALKGGTAINLFLNEMPRLSVDIDLTYLPIESRNDSLEAINNALNTIAKDTQKELTSIYPKIKVRKGYNTSGQIIRLFIQAGKAQVKIEPNLVIRGEVFPSDVRSLSKRVQETFNVELQAPLMSIPDIYGGKICAALDRQHPRDLFDIKELYQKLGLTDDIRKTFIVYLISHDRPIHELIKPKLKDLSISFDAEFKGMPFKEVTCIELEAARTRLISDITTQLSNDERKFLMSIKEGSPKWELLGLPGIEKLPAIQWKLANISKLPKKKHDVLIENLKAALML